MARSESSSPEPIGSACWVDDDQLEVLTGQRDPRTGYMRNAVTPASASIPSRSFYRQPPTSALAADMRQVKRRIKKHGKSPRKKKNGGVPKPWEDGNTSSESDLALEVSEVLERDLAVVDEHEDESLVLQRYYDSQREIDYAARLNNIVDNNIFAAVDVPVRRAMPTRNNTMRQRTASELENFKETKDAKKQKVNARKAKGNADDPVVVNITDSASDDADLRLAVALSKGEAPSTDYDSRVAALTSTGSTLYEAYFDIKIDDLVRRGAMNQIEGEQAKREMRAVETVEGIDLNTTRSCDAYSRLQSAECEEVDDEAVGLFRLCLPAVDHFSWGHGDDKWGCGFRNTQMLWSATNRHPVLYSHLKRQLSVIATENDFAVPADIGAIDDIEAAIALSLNQDVHVQASASNNNAAATNNTSGGSLPVPSVHQIQKLIGRAWALGYDSQAANDFHHQIVGTHEWIGTLEVFALLTSLGIECRGATFHLRGNAKLDARGVPLNGHIQSYASNGSDTRTFRTLFDAMFAWVKRHFGGADDGSSASSYKFPIYLQHDGHSRTIVGYEETQRGDNLDRKLLLFDPAQRQALRTNTGKALLRQVRRLATNFKTGQWQMLTVTGRLLTSDQQTILRHADESSFDTFEFLDDRNVS